MGNVNLEIRNYVMGVFNKYPQVNKQLILGVIMQVAKKFNAVVMNDEAAQKEVIKRMENLTRKW